MKIQCPVCKKEQEFIKIEKDGYLPYYKCHECGQIFIEVPKLYYKKVIKKDGTILHEYRAKPDEKIGIWLDLEL